MKIWNHATGEAWAITKSALDTILAIASRENESHQALAAKEGLELENTHNTQIREGVAIIPVVGPLFRYANLFTAISGATSYELLAKDFMSALENDAVHSILLDIDSPGGEVNGCAELASLIFESRGIKPIIAYASGDAASGAYWIASACDKIIASQTSMLGSIGVVAVYQNDKRDEELEIVSSQSPYKRLDPKSDDGRSRLQSKIDHLADVFIESVAKHRDATPEIVQRDFGGGDVFVGKHAVANRLADSLGSLEKLIAAKEQNSNQKTPLSTSKEITMSENKTKTTPDKTELSLESLTANEPQLVQTIEAQGLAKGVKQERERIGAIIGSDDAKGREQLANHLAFSTELSVEMATSTLKASPVTLKEKASASDVGFEQVMSTVSNPAIKPGEGDDEETREETLDSTAKRIAQFSQGEKS